MTLQEEFERETGKKIYTTGIFDCDNPECTCDVLIDIVNNDYIFWLEQKIKKLNEEAVSEDGFCTNSICTFNEKNTCYFVTRLKKCNDRKNNSA